MHCLRAAGRGRTHKLYVYVCVYVCSNENCCRKLLRLALTKSETDRRADGQTDRTDRQADRLVSCCQNMSDERFIIVANEYDHEVAKAHTHTHT